MLKLRKHRWLIAVDPAVGQNIPSSWNGCWGSKRCACLGSRNHRAGQASIEASRHMSGPLIAIIITTFTIITIISLSSVITLITVRHHRYLQHHLRLTARYSKTQKLRRTSVATITIITSFHQSTIACWLPHHAGPSLVQQVTGADGFNAVATPGVDPNPPPLRFGAREDLPDDLPKELDC